MLIEWLRHREKTETSLWGQASLRHNTNRALTPLGWLCSTVIIHDAEIQVNPLLPGAMPQFPEGPRRDPHKHCDRYLSSLWARQQQLACLHGMQMALHGEERPTALLLAEQTWTAMGRKPAEKQTEGSGQRGRSRNIFHRSNTQWQKMLIRLGPAFSDWTNNTWVGIGWEPGGSLSISFLSTQLLPEGSVKHFRCSHPGLQRIEFYWEQRSWGEEKNDGRKRKDKTGRKGRKIWSESDLEWPGFHSVFLMHIQ